MKKIALFCSLLIVHCSLLSQNPVLLQPWVEVFGDSLPDNTELGAEVRGFVPQPNFNFRSGILQSGVTGLYKNTNASDVMPAAVLNGRMLTLADLNGDGKMDLIMSVFGNGIVPDTVEIFWGTANGLDSINTTKLVGENKNDAFGFSICVGNIVGDSIIDLVITAPGYPQGYDQGKVYIYKGSPQFSTTPYATLLGDSTNYSLGWGCAIGDVNNDGYNDLFIRGYYGNRTPYHAYLDIYWGSANFDTMRAIRILGGNTNRQGLACFDVNGDGIADLLWASRDSLGLDWVYVHYGGSNFSTTPNLRLKDPNGANFGVVIANAGDMNGDGYNDIAVGANLNITTGYVFIYGGGPKINGECDAYCSLSQDSHFGSSVSSVGDINGDGLSDIIVGAPAYPFTQNRGYWGIFLGNKNIKVTSVGKEEVEQPQVFQLHQNYPNPFNGETVISYRLEKAASVTIKITNTVGQEVTMINEGEKEAGVHRRSFNAKDLSSGWYVYTINVTPKGSMHTTTQSKAMIVEK